MIIFKRVERAITLVEKELRQGGDREQGLLKLQALREIFSYLNSGTFLSRSSAKEKLKVFINSNYNYRKSADYFGTSLNSFESFITYCSNKAINKIGGSKIIEMILDGDIDIAISQFRINSTSNVFYSLFPLEVMNSLPRPQLNLEFDIKECMFDLSRLALFTKINMQLQMQQLNKNKLELLLYILGCEDKH